MQMLIDLVNKLTEGINNLSPGMKKFVAVIGVIAFAAGPALIALGSILKLFIGLKIAIAAGKIAGFSFIGMIGTLGKALGALLFKIGIAMLPILAGWIIIQDLLMYMKYGESASFLGPILNNAGRKLHQFVNEWVKKLHIDDIINFFKSKLEPIRKWWDNIWADAWKVLRESPLPSWAKLLIEFGRKGEIFEGMKTGVSATAGLISPGVRDMITIGSVIVNAPMGAGALERQKQQYIDFIKPATQDAIKESVKQVNRQRK